ncbi:MAG: hypothetical protein JXB38_00570 [Anaerolineales bacterium]|nr:hypothetical protein [Anaerolineales bacterium]
MNTRRLVTWIVFLAVFAMAARVAVDTDTWWHLRTGQWIVEQRAVPKTDPFSYTQFGESWKYPSANWIAEVMLYLIYQAFGPGGLIVWVAALVTLAYAFLWRTMSGGVFLKAFVIILSVTVAGVYWAARPYMLTFVYMATTLWILEGHRNGGKDRLWWLPVVVLVWANSHGGIAVGFILWGVYGLQAGVSWLQAGWEDAEGRFSRAWLQTGLRGRVGKMLLVGLVMLAAVCVNPSGPSMLAYTYETVSIGALQDLIGEWQSPNFHELRVQPFLILLFLTFGAVGVSKQRLQLVDFLLVSGFGVMALMAGRNFVLFALAAPVVLARYAAPVSAELGGRLGFHPIANSKPTFPVMTVINWGLVGLLLAAAVLKVAAIYPQAFHEEIFAASLPVGAVEYLRENEPPGRLMNAYNWGGYLIWELPEYPVFVDGRTDLYRDEIIGQWLQVFGALDGWRQVLDEWQVNLILIEPHWELNYALEDADWEILYQDDVSILYGR